MKKTPDKRRIFIAATSDLSTDQRVLKIARTFHQHGWRVLLIGRLLPDSRPLTTEFENRRMKLLFNSGFLFYFEFNLRLLFISLFSNISTIYSNDTDTLAASYIASRIRRKQLIFDAHELFPEVPELQHRHFVKQFWQSMEDLIIPRLDKTITVCDSIAQHYFKRYGITMKVVRNVPYRRTNQDSLPLPVPEGKKIILYQGALNTGRGLEWVIDAMPLVENAVLYIIGDGDIREELQARVKRLQLTDRVMFHGKAEATELHKYTPSASIGLCLLENRGMSYYYALPNRIFDYMHAGVPVLASPFPEIKSIVETHKTGILTSDYSAQALALTINQMLINPYPTQHLRTISAEFCWEKEELKILELL